VLPGFLGEVVLRNVSVGRGAVDLALRQAGDDVVVQVLRRDGNARVLTIK